MVHRLVAVGWLMCFNDPQSYVNRGFGRLVDSTKVSRAVGEELD